tara:strand:+ start:2548 stop:4266 length:1719 start_codon:yes stop_codon:yes gene_type:complete
MEKINKLKQAFKKEKIDGYIIPKNDEFFNEYIPNYNDRLNYISSFSGSYGFSLVMKNANYLFVDGRYTLQAIRQSGNFFQVKTLPREMPKDIFKNKKFIIGYDPKLITSITLNIFFAKENCIFKALEDNLIDKIWKRKTKERIKKFYKLPNNSVSNSYKVKINKIVNFLKKEKGDFQFISASENNAWLLNIRGRDTEYTPIPNSYVLIDKYKNVKFFCNLKKISSSLKRQLKEIDFVDIKLISKILSKIEKKKFIIDKNTCSIFFENIIKKNNKILNIKDPIYILKAIKNRKEIQNMEYAHIVDGAALTKCLFWIKKNFLKKKITEISASKKLLEYRKKSRKFKFSSFPTISGSGPNGAIIHYKATNKTNRDLKKGDIYLVDSGGQYEFGTTDVTRTISLGNSNKRIKNIFTRVLKGHIAVADYNFKKNTSGSEIDIKARESLNQIGLDYAHGTGHGVGYFLNVHEGPHAISKNNNVVLQEGMIVSNEPGYYEKNKFGIRIENLVCIKKKKNKKYFANLTMAPIDKDLIDKKFLNGNEKNWLNNYHTKVFNKLKKRMNKTEIFELKKACSAI